MAGAGISFSFGEIGHNLATNKCVEVKTVFSHDVASLAGEIADEAADEALGFRDVGCCSIRDY